MGLITDMRLWFGQFFLFFLFLCTTASANYTVVDLGFSGLENSSAIEIRSLPHAYDVNNSGEVAGRYKHGFLWRGAPLTGVIDRKWNRSIAVAINEAGQLALNGPPEGASQGTIPYRWDKQTGLYPLTLPRSSEAFVRDINDNEILVGDYRETNSDPWSPYIWYANDQVSNLGGLGGENGRATAINNAEPVQVVGTAQAEDGRYHAFLWTDGSGDNAGIRRLNETDEHDSVATAINDHGDVVGWHGSGPFSVGYMAVLPARDTGSSSSFLSHAFLLTNDTWKDLGTLAINDRGVSAAYDINNNGQVVGFAETGMGDLHAFLYTVDEIMVDLNTLIPADSGWELQLAHGISDNGQIVGWGVLNGQRRAFLLIPVGLPNTIDISVDHSYRPRSPRLGEALTVTTTISNDGSETLAVHLQQTLGPELMLESISGYCTQNENTLSCDLGDMAGGDSIAIEHVAKSSSSGRFPLKSTATGSALSLVKDIAVTTAMIPITRHDPDTTETYAIKLLNGGATYSHDRGPRINKWGEVAFARNRHVYSGGEIQNKVSSGNILLNDLNDRGDFVGYADSGTTKIAGLFQGGDWSRLNTLPYSSGQSEALAVNKNGLVVINNVDNHQAFSVKLDSDPTYLGDLGNGKSEGRAVNDDGWIVGHSLVLSGDSHAFLYKSLDEGMIDLYTLGGSDSFAYAINNKGDIVGASHNSNEILRAALYRQEEGWVDLGALSVNGVSRALGINESSVAVGYAVDTDNKKKAVRYIDNRVEDLNAYLSSNSAWQLSKASGINDAGEIVGVGSLSGGATQAAFLMSHLDNPPVFSKQHLLEPTNNDSMRGVGSSVALDGNTLAIGSPYDSQLGANAGAVFIYQRKDDADEWGFHRKLMAQDGKSSDEFGHVLALKNGRLAVGSKSAAYIFECGDGNCEPVGNKIQFVSNGVSALAIDTNVVAIVGTRVVNRKNYNVHVFRLIDGDWVVELERWEGDPHIVLYGSQLFVGYRYYGNGWIETYGFDGDEWIRQDRFLGKGNNDSLERESFGASLAFHGGYLVVGAPGTRKTNGKIWGSGAVYVYRKRDDGTWVQYARLLSSDFEDSRKPGGSGSAMGEQFGSSVDIHGDLIVVGAPNGNEGEHGAGAVYVFQRQGNHWFEEIKLTTPNPVVNQKFGTSVAIDGNKIVAGAPNRPDGTVYTYTLQNSPDSADLGVTMIKNHEVVGVTETLTYSVNVNNFSDVDASGVKVSLELPEALKFISSSDDRCTQEVGFVICDLKQIPAQSTHKITVNTEAIEQGTASAQVTVNAYQTDPQPENNMVSINTQIEPEPFPRITFKSINNDDEIMLTRYDALDIEFEIENWNFGEDGEAYWLLNNNEQETLHSAGVVNIGALKEDEYIFTIKLVDSDNRVFEGSVRFEIKEAPWPSVQIETPANGDTFTIDSTILLRYRLDYAGVAQNESDFILIVNGVSHGPLTNPRSLILDNLEPGKQNTVEIQYKGSKQPDAKVEFHLNDNINTPQEDSVDDQPQVGVSTTGGGGVLSITMIIIFLMRYCSSIPSFGFKYKISNKYCIEKIGFNTRNSLVVNMKTTRICQ